MSPTMHTILAYGVSVLLLWGYAVMLWVSAGKISSDSQDKDTGDRSETL